PAGATTDNNNQMASVGWHCRLLPIKSSIDLSPQIYRGYQGIVAAADMGAHFINCAWGGSIKGRFGEDAVNYAVINKGAAVIASGGNTPIEVAFYPASFHNVMSVTGSENQDAFWTTDPGFGSSYHHLADLCAPAEGIWTTASHTGMIFSTGTSLSSPIVCGAAGLVKDVHPTYTNEQAAQRVRVAADPAIYGINSATYTDKMGRGRVDCYNALVDSSPSVRILEVEYDDHDDHLLQVGDTVDVKVRFANFLNAAEMLNISLSTPDWGQFEVIHSDVYVGDLGTMDTASTWLAPFKLVVRSGTPEGFTGHLKFTYQGTDYDDWEYYPIQTAPAYVHVDANRLETTINGVGRWGYTSFPALNR
ncbi:MAG: S8 family serine peptidase, partial [Bacteroidota bacterium]